MNMNPEKAPFPSFEMVDKGKIQAVVDYVADYMPDIYHILDRERLTKYVSTRIRYQQQVQQAQLDFQNKIVKIQTEFQNDVLELIG